MQQPGYLQEHCHHQDTQDVEAELRAVKNRRIGAAVEWEHEQEYDRLRVREKCAEARISQLKRNLK